MYYFELISYKQGEAQLGSAIALEAYPFYKRD